MRTYIAALVAALVLFSNDAEASEPFDFMAVKLIPVIRTSLEDNIVRKWEDILPRIEQDFATIKGCGSECPAEVQRFNRIVAIGENNVGRTKFGLVNREVNQAIYPMSDLRQYGVEDYWATALETFVTGYGDCDKYATAKYEILIEAGVPKEVLRLIVVDNKGGDHMILAARLGDTWLALDNHTNILVELNEMLGQEGYPYRPRFLLGPGNEIRAYFPLRTIN